MALNSNTYSGKQFTVYLASETTTGTFNTTDANYHRVDVEGITLPTFSPVQEFEMRSGSGRIAEFDQVFSSSKRVMTEFTLSGRLTQEMWVILMENCISDSFDGGTGSDSVLSMAYNFSPGNFKVGTDPSSATDFTKLLSVYFAAPTAADSYSLKSCIVTNFTIDADMDSAAGRFNYSAGRDDKGYYIAIADIFDTSGSTSAGELLEFAGAHPINLYGRWYFNANEIEDIIVYNDTDNQSIKTNFKGDLYPLRKNN